MGGSSGGWCTRLQGACQKIPRVERSGCAAQTPDLNLIEALWQDVEVKLGQIWGRVSDLEALEAAVKTAWNTISEELLEELIRSMPA